jgi:hemolysin-activating ACP:hemolysin acyltransferase
MGGVESPETGWSLGSGAALCHVPPTGFAPEARPLGVIIARESRRREPRIRGFVARGSRRRDAFPVVYPAASRGQASRLAAHVLANRRLHPRGSRMSIESDELRLVQLPDGNSAFSQAVRFTMAEPVYAALPFGKWARVLDGQVGRNHYAFAIDASGQIRGFVGWALTSEAKAESWAAGLDSLEDADCRAGDCVIFNAWIAKDRVVHRFMVREIRPFMLGRKTAYFNRAYSDGTRRIVRLPINDMVEAHVAALARA